MTLQNSSFKKIGMNRKLLAFSYRQNWPFLIASGLIYFCVITLPTVLFFSSNATYFENVAGGFVGTYYTPAMQMEYILEETTRFIKTDGIFLWAVTCMVAVVAGIISIRFLNNKVSVNFWHSVPVRRENLMFNDFIVYSSYFVAVLLVNIALEGIIILSFVGKYLTAKMCGEIISVLLTRFGIAVLLFFFVYAVMLFAASLTGSDFMRFSTGMLILFYPVTVVLSLIGAMMWFSQYTVWEYYLNERFLDLFSPIVRLFAADTIPLKWYTVALILFFTCAFLFLAAFLYQRRKSESAGTPVIHRTAAVIIKYGVVAVATLLGGLFFNSLFGSIAWLLFGFLIGAFFSFMLINSVLEKSPKAMFKNMKGLAVFGACFLVFFVVFVVDIFGFDRHVPKWNIKDVTVDIGDFSVTCEDEEAKALLEMFEELVEKKDNGEFSTEDIDKVDARIKFTYESKSYDHYFSYAVDFSPIYITINRDIGIPVKKYVLVPSAVAGDMLSYIKQTANLRREKLEEISISDVNYIYLSLGEGLYRDLEPDFYQDLETIHTFLSLLSTSVEEDVVAPVVGHVGVNGNNMYWEYDLYASDFEAIKYALANFEWYKWSEFYDETIPEEITTSVESPEALLRAMSRQYELALVYDWEADAYVIYEDSESIFSIFKQCSNVMGTVKGSLYFEIDDMCSVVFYNFNDSAASGNTYFETVLVKGSSLPEGNWIQN